MRQQVATAPITNDRTNDGMEMGADSFLDNEQDNGYEEYSERKRALVRDWAPKVVRFEGNTATVLGGANAYGLVEIPGPRLGYIWEIVRLTGSFWPLVVAGNKDTTPNFSSAMLWEVDPGTTENTALFPSGSAQPLATYGPILDNASQFYGLSDTYNPHTITVNPGKNLALYINGLGFDSPTVNTFVVSGQAIEIPQACYNDWLYG